MITLSLFSSTDLERKNQKPKIYYILAKAKKNRTEQEKKNKENLRGKNSKLFVVYSDLLLRTKTTAEKKVKKGDKINYNIEFLNSNFMSKFFM